MEARLTSQASLVASGAIAIGIADATLIASGKLGAAGAFQYVPPRLWFVAPLCWIVVAMSFAIPSYAIARKRGGVVTVTAMLALFAWVRLHHASTKLMVAGAVSVAVAGIIVWIAGARWIEKPRRIPAVFTALVFVASCAGSVVRDREPARAKPAAHGPDVIVAFLDTVPYASARDLPFLSKFPLVFDRAYSTSPWTLPAHVSAVTGVPAHRLEVGFDHQHYDGSAATLAERFRRRGYRTAAVMSNTFLNRGTGLTRGFDVYEHAENALDVCRTAPGTLLDQWWPWFAASVCNWTASEVTRRAVAQLDEGPVFLLLNYMDGHDPYFVERDCARPKRANPFPREVPAAEYRQRYYASHLAAVRCIDRHLAELSTELQRRNRDAVFVVLADHGEHFGERGLVRHGNSVYDPLLHVPFMIDAPGLTPRHIQEPVSIEELPRIVIDVLDGRPAVARTAYVVSSLVPPAALHRQEEWSIHAGRWHFIRRGKTEELYDVVADPEESRNLGTRRDLAEILDREIRTRSDHRADAFRSVGYIR